MTLVVQRWCGGRGPRTDSEMYMKKEVVEECGSPVDRKASQLDFSSACTPNDSNNNNNSNHNSNSYNSMGGDTHSLSGRTGKQQQQRPPEQI